MKADSNQEREMQKRWGGPAKFSLALAAACLILAMTATTAAANTPRGTMELEVIEIESEVPRRIAQFFVQRDRLNYQPVDDQPSFLPELLNSVNDDPF